VNIFFSIALIVFGVAIFIITLNDGKNRKSELTTSYVMHLKGYFGGIGLIIIGLLLLFKNI
jgi:uncharacterized membrane protein YidH (DUF202 family)